MLKVTKGVFIQPGFGKTVRDIYRESAATVSCIKQKVTISENASALTDASSEMKHVLPKSTDKISARVRKNRTGLSLSQDKPKT